MFDINYIREKKKRVMLIAATTAVVLILTGIFLFSLFAANKLSSGATLNGVSIGGLTLEELEEVIENDINPPLSELALKLVYGEGTLEVTAGEYGFAYDAATVFEEAKAFNFKSDEEFHPTVGYDGEKVYRDLELFRQETNTDVVPYSYEVKETTLEVAAGKAGTMFNFEQAVKDLVDQFKSNTSNTMTVELELVEITDDTIPINLERILEEVHSEPQDASYSIDDAGILTYAEGQDGLSFDMEVANGIVADAQSGQYEIPLVITSPGMTVEQLRAEHDSASCPDLLQEYTTNFSGNANRSFNIARAASILSGTVLYPGERFSFNDIVGYTNQANGYKEATVYTSTGSEIGFGGGVCQVSTTVYNAALYGYMEITARTNHSYTVGYVPLGMDAAVTDGGLDLCFKNTRDNPVKVVATTTNTSITVQIYGTKSDMDNYKVSCTSQTVGTTAFETTYRDNSDMLVGEERTISSGQTGYSVEVSKVVTYNGSVVSSSRISSYYSPMNQIVERGTKQPEPEE